MDIQFLTSFFGWAAVISCGLLLISATISLMFPDGIYKMHKKMYGISRDAYNVLIYSFLGLFKVLAFMLFIIPWLALKVIA